MSAAARPWRLWALPLAALVLALAIGLSPLTRGSGVSVETAYSLLLPRAVLGALVGGALAACGAVLQGVLRNPLASPYTLGLASGAAVGAAAAILVGGTPQLVPATFLGALVGALSAAALVYAIAARSELAAETLLLAGVAVALFGGAVTSLMHYLAGKVELTRMLLWSLGSLVAPDFGPVYLALPGIALGGLGILWVWRRLEVATLDDDSARALGVDPVKVRRVAFASCAVITAAAVSVAGPVGFVGLIVPHAARALVGPDPRLLLPCSTLLGGAALVAADVVARTVWFPEDLPINLITHAVGCPLFVLILLRQR
ncbi:MAG: iron ABC transporter permease [Planctomycetes bacterium]|nr:iron ABC transporter permease [Planctomycetota bacterium]